MSLARFEAKFVPEPNSGCWIWTGCMEGCGYGIFVEMVAGARKLRKAHRVSWEIFNGPIPVGACILHKCDNRLCVNPSHLFIGDRADNMRDMAAKGRGKSIPRPGEKNPSSKLTATDVQELRQRVARGESQTFLAVEYGVSQSAVSLAVAGKTWSIIS